MSEDAKFASGTEPSALEQLGLLRLELGLRQHTLVAKLASFSSCAIESSAGGAGAAWGGASW